MCGAFAACGLRYAVVGGHAVALHGAVRGTVDVDIALTWTKKSLEEAERVLGELDSYRDCLCVRKTCFDSVMST